MIKGIFGNLARFVQNILVFTIAAGGYISINGKRLYPLTTVITPNVTTTSAPAGSFGWTTSTTGSGHLLIFYSDGTKWQTYTG